MGEITRLQNPPAPNLPIAPNQYAMQHFDVHNNVLRLYFNRLSDSLAALFANNGGRFLNAPYVTSYSLADQYALGNNTPTQVAWDPTKGSYNGFDLSTGSAVAKYSGTYKVEYSIQLANDAAAQHEAYFWFKTTRNGVTDNEPDSTSKFTLEKASSHNTFVVAYSFLFVELNAGDSIELWWETDQAATSGGTKGVWIEFDPATVNYPATPSSLGSITFVSAPQA